MIALDSFRALEGMIELGGEQSVKLVGWASDIILLMVNEKISLVCVCVWACKRWPNAWIDVIAIFHTSSWTQNLGRVHS